MRAFGGDKPLRNLEVTSPTAPPRRILVISLAGIGDTLMATPLITELRRRFPEAELDALVLWKGSAEILRDNPHLNQVFVHNFLKEPKLDSVRFLLQIRSRRYDLSLNTHPQGRRAYRVIARIVGARHRLSHSYENQSWLDSWLVTHQFPQSYAIPCSVNNLRLLNSFLEDANPTGDRNPRDTELSSEASPLPFPEYALYLSDSEKAWAVSFLEAQGLDGTRWLGVHVGSGGTKNLSARRWPLDLYEQLFESLIDNVPGIRILVFGGPNEAEAHRQLTARFPAAQVTLAVTPDLRHAAALLSHAHAFLSVDTAFMHLAAWAKVPHQFVMETPTLTPSVYPPRPDFIRISNPGIRGRHLDYYRYDGRPIAGTRRELEQLMRHIKPEVVLSCLTHLEPGLGSQSPKS